jgi:hypothetical protein
MTRSAVSLLALLGAVLAAVPALALCLLWENDCAPRSLLLDIAFFALAGLAIAALARSSRARRPGLETLFPSALSVLAPVRASWLSVLLWALAGALLAAAGMGSLVIAPWLTLASLSFAVAGFKAGLGLRMRAIRGIGVILFAALLNGVVLWLLLLSAYSPVLPDQFRAMDLYANELLADVPVHDMWIVQLEGGGEGCTVQDVQTTMASVSAWDANPLVVVLVSMRGLLGWALGWDEESSDQDELSYLNRVADEVRARSLQEPGVEGGYFRLMYTLENETVAEILNRTVHAFFCMAIEPAGGGYTLYWVILVKEERSLTPFYMGLIDPFRRYLVHPTILRTIEQRWRHLHRGEASSD